MVPRVFKIANALRPIRLVEEKAKYAQMLAAIHDIECAFDLEFIHQKLFRLALHLIKPTMAVPKQQRISEDGLLDVFLFGIVREKSQDALIARKIMEIKAFRELRHI